MTTSIFPDGFDSNLNLYQVHDGLRVVLSEDYNPGDVSIQVLGSEEMMRRFNNNGIITLTEQCSEPELRAISFSYTERTLDSFLGLQLLSGFTDVPKPKTITNVTQNVMSAHHNNLKDAVLAIQQFAGIKGEVGTKPLEGTMEQRINYLRKIVLQPKAWFKVDKTVGLYPLTVKFTDQSFRLGTDGNTINLQFLWDFGDNTSSVISMVSYTSVVPSTISNVLVSDLDGGDIIKTYTEPGIYSVKLTVTNDFGSDSVTFNDLISARFPAPGPACVTFTAKSNQIITNAGVPSGGPYTTVPVIRAPVNSIIDMYIPSSPPTGNPNTPGISYAGEQLDGLGNPRDPVITYTWNLSDDIPHSNASFARAVFSVGGVYDMVLRCDTEFGSYRITTYEDSFDIVEKLNLYLWIYDSDDPTLTTRSASVSEFGLLSETFKSLKTTLPINTDEDFLTSQNNAIQQKKEFHRNAGFAQTTNLGSGNGGKGVAYWASGRSSASSVLTEEIKSSEFNGFTLTYASGFTKALGPLYRPWNWLSFASTKRLWFLLGSIPSAYTPFTSPTNQRKDSVDLTNLIADNPGADFDPTNYKNGADELQTNEYSSFDGGGEPVEGNFSVYRSVWHVDSGYILRNESTGDFFRIRSFYKTSGNTSNPVIDIRKLPDMGGSARLEGQLLSLSQGLYFFSNSGAIAAYSPTAGVWGTGGPGINSPAFRALQDTTDTNFDDSSQRLLGASDSDKIAYLSFDYSPNVFIKFNEVSTTFSSVTPRPAGSQWNMTIF